MGRLPACDGVPGACDHMVRATAQNHKLEENLVTRRSYTFCAQTSGEFGFGTLWGLRLRVKTSLAASSSFNFEG